MHMRSRFTALSGLVLAVALSACAKEHGVLRAYDGRLVEGTFIEPEAYAEFLRGAILEDGGDLKGALAAYVDAVRYDQGDAEIWTRIASVECKLDPRAVAADVALTRAFALDGDYADAWATKAACQLARGESAEEAAIRATEADPMSDDLQVLRARSGRRDAFAVASWQPLARGEIHPSDDASRRRLLALTLMHGEREAAWEALAVWARVHDDVQLYARALSELARRGFGRRAEIVFAATELAGEGELAAAHEIAAASADAPLSEAALSIGAQALVARLAVDDALVRRDLGLARLRATRTHVALDEVASRALLLGEVSLARELAAPVAAADPHAVGARLVLAVAADASGNPTALAAIFKSARSASGPVPQSAALAFAMLIAREVSVEAARHLLLALPRAPFIDGDALVTSIAVDLAARGVLDDAQLALDALTELAARRGQPPPAAALADAPPLTAGLEHATDEPRTSRLDARHMLLALALAEPTSPRTRALAGRMARHGNDALVAVALARLDLAWHPEQLAPDAASLLLARGPGDPLIAAVALDLATRRGDGPSIHRARAVLTAIAQTPAERRRLE